MEGIGMDSNEVIKIALVDDHKLFREGVKRILSFEPSFEVVAEADDGAAAKEIVAQYEPDVVLMDINMPEYNGVEATKYISQKFTDIDIIALSSYTSESFMKKMLSVGAVCYIPKSITPAEMIHRIKMVYQNGFCYEEFMLSFIKNKYDDKSSILNSEITERELEILKFICLQKSSAEIAEILSISPRTVDGHRNNLLSKTESKNIVGLVVYAIQNRLFVPGIEN